jgi:hypothetical protein
MQFKKETGLGEEERGGKMITQSCLLRKNNFSKNKLQFANHGAKKTLLKTGLGAEGGDNEISQPC